MNTHVFQHFKIEDFHSNNYHQSILCHLCNEPAMNNYTDEICRFCEKTFCNKCIKLWHTHYSYSVCILCIQNIKYINHTYFITALLKLNNCRMVN